MIVTCTRCQARFRVPDEKVGPRGARIRCARCQALFAIGPAPIAGTGARQLPPTPAAPATPEVELEAPAREAPSHVPADDPFAGFRLDEAAPLGPARAPPRRSGDPFDGFEPGAPGAAAPADPFASGGTAQVAPVEQRIEERGPPWTEEVAGLGDGVGAVAPGAELAWADDRFAAAISPRAERAGLPEPSLPLTDLADLVRDEPRPPAVPPPLPSARTGPLGFAPAPETRGRLGPDLALEEPTTPPPRQAAPSFAAGADLLGLSFPEGPDDLADGPHELGAPAGPEEEPLALATEPATGLPEVWRTSQQFAPEAEEEPEPPAPRPDSPRRDAPAQEGDEAARAAGRGSVLGALRSVAVNALSLAALLVVALAFRVLWRGDGALGSALSSPAALLRAVGLRAPPAAVLETARVTSGRYPRAAGPPLLLVRGEVIASSAAPLARARVEVEVVRAGRVIAHRSGLAGAIPTAEELHAVRDAAALDALTHATAARAPAVRPGRPEPFLVAFADVPEDLTGASVRVVASPAPAPAGERR